MSRSAQCSKDLLLIETGQSARCSTNWFEVLAASTSTSSYRPTLKAAKNSRTLRTDSLLQKPGLQVDQDQIAPPKGQNCSRAVCSSRNERRGGQEWHLTTAESATRPAHRPKPGSTVQEHTTAIQPHKLHSAVQRPECSYLFDRYNLVSSDAGSQRVRHEDAFLEELKFEQLATAGRPIRSRLHSHKGCVPCRKGCAAFSVREHS